MWRVSIKKANVRTDGLLNAKRVKFTHIDVPPVITMLAGQQH